PVKAASLEVQVEERPLRTIDAVQVLDEETNSLKQRVVQRVPVEALVVVPFPPLPELAAHEHELFAGMRVHEPVERAQCRRFLPVVAWNLAEHRPFAVNDF